MGRDPGEIYSDLTREFGEPFYERINAPATLEQKAVLEKLSAEQVKIKDLAGEKIQAILTNARATARAWRRSTRANQWIPAWVSRQPGVFR